MAAERESPPDPAAMRRQYGRAALREEDVAPEPLAQFTAWFREAIDGGLAEPNAMTLATAGADGFPAARTVLLKHFDERGFVCEGSGENIFIVTDGKAITPPQTASILDGITRRDPELKGEVSKDGIGPGPPGGNEARCARGEGEKKTPA